MSIKDVVYASSKGFVDSLKGVYWLFALDGVQQRTRMERQAFRDLKTTSNNKSSRKNKGIHAPSEEPRLLKRVIQCGTLNGFVFGFSIFLFKSVLLPLLQTLISLLSRGSSPSSFWSWLQFLLNLTFDTLWVLPLFLLSRVVNALWFQDIGSLAYRYSVGRPKTIQSISTFVADNLFSLVIQAAFLVQAVMVAALLPHLAGHFMSQLIYTVHLSLLYSLYSFEYKWVQMGLPLHQRLNYIETNWPYFIGFGLPLTLLTNCWSDWVIGACVFAVLFPVFIISGNEADVVVVNGIKRLKLFSGVVVLSNFLMGKGRR